MWYKVNGDDQKVTGRSGARTGNVSHDPSPETTLSPSEPKFAQISKLIKYRSYRSIIDIQDNIK